MENGCGVRDASCRQPDNDSVVLKYGYPEESVNISTELYGPCWLHHGDKGYVIVPAGKVNLNITTGSLYAATPIVVSIRK